VWFPKITTSTHSILSTASAGELLHTVPSMLGGASLQHLPFITHELSARAMPPAVNDFFMKKTYI